LIILNIGICLYLVSWLLDITCTGIVTVTARRFIVMERADLPAVKNTEQPHF
jgi:hypothetical protein